MSDHDQLPSIAESQRTPLVAQLLEQIAHLLEENRKQVEWIQQLRDEIAVLKGQKAKPPRVRCSADSSRRASRSIW